MVQAMKEGKGLLLMEYCSRQVLDNGTEECYDRRALSVE
jgi:hypothetical protein